MKVTGTMGAFAYCLEGELGGHAPNFKEEGNIPILEPDEVEQKLLTRGLLDGEIVVDATGAQGRRPRNAAAMHDDGSCQTQQSRIEPSRGPARLPESMYGERSHGREL